MIQTLHNAGEIFDPRNHFTLQEYFNSLMKAHDDMVKVVVRFDRSVASYTKNARYYYGFVSEEDLGEKCRLTFLIANVKSFCRWLMMFGKSVEIESPDVLKETMEELVEELRTHYSSLTLLPSRT